MSERSTGANPEPLEKLWHSEFNQMILDYLRGHQEAVWSWYQWRSVWRKPKHESDGDDRKHAAVLGVCAGVCVCPCICRVMSIKILFLLAK